MLTRLVCMWLIFSVGCDGAGDGDMMHAVHRISPDETKKGNGPGPNSSSPVIKSENNWSGAVCGCCRLTTTTTPTASQQADVQDDLEPVFEGSDTTVDETTGDTTKPSVDGEGMPPSEGAETSPPGQEPSAPNSPGGDERRQDAEAVGTKHL